MATGAVGADPRLERFHQAVDAAPVQAGQLRLLLLAVLLLLTDGYDLQAIGYAAPAIAEQWHVARAAFGPVFAIGMLGVTVGAMATTPLADRIGGRRVLMAAAAWYAVMSIATAFATSLSMLTGLRFLAGLGIGGCLPNVVALVSDYAPRRLRNMMVTLTVCGFSLGGAFGGLLAALMMDDFGWQGVFVLGGLIPLVLLPFAAAWLPESPARLLRREVPARLAALAEGLAPGWRRAPTAAAPAAAPEAPVRRLFTGGYALTTTMVWAAIFMNLLLLYLMANWLPLLIRGSGLTMKLASLSIAFYQGAGTIGAIILAAICDRWRPQPVLATVFLGAAATMLALGHVGRDGHALLALAAAAGFCIVGGQVGLTAFSSVVYPPGMRSTGVGWALGVGRIGSILGPLFGGALVATGGGMGPLFQICAIPAALAALAIFLARAPQRPA